MYNSDLSLREVLGLTPQAPRQAWLAVRGDPSIPPSRADLTSLRQFTPRLALATWLGRRPVARHTVIVNLVNHTPVSPESGWSVRVTQTRDFRGRGLTYDSHNGTDFAIPPGTAVVAAAPGVVVSVRSEYNRGGTKVAIDHGAGLLTSSNHLARAWVVPGQRLQRGEQIGLSGYSGLDALLSLGMVAPHVHFNVALGGVLVDPFAALPHERGAASLWRGGQPLPFQAAAPADDAAWAPSAIDLAAADRLLVAMKDDARRAELAAIPDPTLRAWELMLETLVYPVRFASPDAGTALFATPTRHERLDLPFAAADFDGAVFADDVGFQSAPARA